MLEAQLALSTFEFHEKKALKRNKKWPKIRTQFEGVFSIPHRYYHLPQTKRPHFYLAPHVGGATQN